MLCAPLAGTSGFLRLPASPAAEVCETFVSAKGRLWQGGRAEVASNSLTITVPGYGVVTVHVQGK